MNRDGKYCNLLGLFFVHDKHSVILANFIIKLATLRKNK